MGVPWPILVLFALAYAEIAWTVAQAWTTEAPATAGVEWSGRAVMMSVAMFALACLVTILGASYLERLRRRDDEAARLQSAVVEGLQREPRLAHLAVAPTAHVLPEGAATLEITGRVPTRAERGLVLDIVRRQAERLPRPIEIVDHIEVDAA